jgi:DNA helicase-2/ATP-dependent DNA helicase PcrA
MPDTLFGYRLREAQQAVMRYQGGHTAVSAVPGSGKTLTLALLAARLIVDGLIGPASEVLVVTVQNSAVDNISSRIRRILSEQRLPPVGYRVCTLHKLGSDILRQRMDLAGVSEDLGIVDESESRRMMRNAAETWVMQHSGWWESFLPVDWPGDRSKIADEWLKETVRIGLEVTKLCKHLRLSPEAAQGLISTAVPEADLARIGVTLYALYERHLRNRSGLDFDDLIWRAIDALEQDDSFCVNLRQRWPFILEDEAQDSSPLQEAILRRLCGKDGNWVRVGDPNQAINATFTAADPRYFRHFLEQPTTHALTLSESGRCARPIIALANALVEWGACEHPEAPVREMAFERQQIEPTHADDPQQNPTDEACHVYIHAQPFAKVDEEALRVATWAAHYIARHPDHSVAILCPAGWQGQRVVEHLQMMHGVAFEDLLRTTPEARNVARLLGAVCRYVGDPTRGRPMEQLLRDLASSDLLGDIPEGRLRALGVILRSISPQELLFPRTAQTLRERLPPGAPITESDLALLDRFTQLGRRWVRAASLPIDQLILAIAQDLFGGGQGAGELSSLAICHTIALTLRGIAQSYPEMRAAEFAGELVSIAQNRRGLRELSLPDANYLTKPGVIVVTTMHKAKGLEWDAVYLMCVDSLEFPDSVEGAYRDEPYYMMGRAPAQEARGLLARAAGDGLPPSNEHGIIAQARLETIAERLRLLYVAVTRARRNLALTWSEKNGTRSVQPALALDVLRAARDRYAAGEEEPWR